MIAYDQDCGDARRLPGALIEVALIDARDCAAIGGMSASWWHLKVRLKEAPAPAFQRPRFTRWRVVDVAAYWQRFIAMAAADKQAAKQMLKNAKRASAMARTQKSQAMSGAAPVGKRKAKAS